MPSRNTFTVLVYLFLVISLLTSGCSRLAPTPEPTFTPAPTPTPTPTQAATPAASTSPEETLQAFLDWYSTYPGDVLADKAYKTSPYLGNQFIDYLGDMSASGYPVDPIFCVPERPTTYTLGQPAATGNQVKITVGSGEGSGVTFSLQQYGSQWLIIGNNCIMPF